MKNLTKVTKHIQKCLFISLIFMIFSTSAVYAQNQSARVLSDDDGRYQLEKEIFILNIEKNKMNEKAENILPGTGLNFNKLAKRVFNYLVDEESSTVNIVIEENKNFQSVALTSSFINDQLLGGMKLELHANPLKGRGALMFRKTF